MRFRISAVFVLFLMSALFVSPAWADGGPPFNPRQQPLPQSPYGMDIMGPGWQWTFPREEAWPRENGEIRVDLLDEAFQKSHEAGVRSARIAVWWCLTEPERDSYRWQELDVAFQIAQNYGMEIVPQIFYTPDWAAIGHDSGATCFDHENYPRNLPPQDWNDWSDFMAALTKRYGASGKNLVHNWEIWNEPDLLEFWYIPGDPWNANAPQYAKLVKLARAEVDRYDNGGNLLAGSLSDIYGANFLKRLMALEGDEDIRSDIDILTFHIFDEPERKLDGIRKALGENTFDMWVTEFNARQWDETVSAQDLQYFFDVLKRNGVTRSFWFMSWTSKWGPGIFLRDDPVWERQSFAPSPFYDTYQNQALIAQPPASPASQLPHQSALTRPQPVFTWQRPAPGSYAIAGYKLQVDNSLFRGRPYFQSPELDAWVPASLVNFLPLQIISGAGVAASPPAPQDVTPPTVAAISFQPTQALPPGRYFWRVAAVDVEGNVGAYSPVRTLFVSDGSERVFLPILGQLGPQ